MRKIKYDLRLTGRTNRKAYALRTIMNWVLICAVLIIGRQISEQVLPEGSTALQFLIMLISRVCALYLVASQFAVSARRGHDCGWSGWTALLALLPGLGFVVLMYKGSDEGANLYGQPT